MRSLRLRRAAWSAPGGEVTRYDYDGAGNLASVTWPDGHLRRYHYEDARHPDAQGRKLRERAHDGSVSFFAYDTKGREVERAVFPAAYAEATTRPALSAATSVTSARHDALAFLLPATRVASGRVRPGPRHRSDAPPADVPRDTVIPAEWPRQTMRSSPAPSPTDVAESRLGFWPLHKQLADAAFTDPTAERLHDVEAWLDTWCRHDPELCWATIVEIWDRVDHGDLDTLANLGAGPVEDLLCNWVTTTFPSSSPSASSNPTSGPCCAWCGRAR